MPHSRMYSGRHSTINTSGVQLVQGNPVCAHGIQIYAEGSCWIGHSGYAFTDALYPFPLASGDSLFLPLTHPDDLYVQAPTSGVTVYYTYL